MCLSTRFFTNRDKYINEMQQAGYLKVSQLVELSGISMQTLIDAGLLRSIHPLKTTGSVVSDEQVTFLGQLFFIKSDYCTFFKRPLLVKLKEYLSNNNDIGFSINEYNNKYHYDGYIRTVDRKGIKIFFESEKYILEEVIMPTDSLNNSSVFFEPSFVFIERYLKAFNERVDHYFFNNCR
jgi:hypothetical protein